MGIIVIDPGHGGHHPEGRSSPYGARGPQGFLEKDLNLEIAYGVARRLPGRVVMTRTEDANLSLADRIEVARQAGASAFVSVHSGADGTRPSEVWVHSRCSSASMALAHRLAAGLGNGAATAAVRQGELAVLSPERFGAGTACCMVEINELGSVAGEEWLVARGGHGIIADRLAGALRQVAYGNVAATTNAQSRAHIAAFLAEVKLINRKFRRKKSSLAGLLSWLDGQARNPQPQLLANVEDALAKTTDAADSRLDKYVHSQVDTKSRVLHVGPINKLVTVWGTNTAFPSEKVLERKNNWQQGTLHGTFLHATTYPPAQAQQTGFDPVHAREWCVPQERNRKLPWNQFLFVFQKAPNAPADLTGKKLPLVARPFVKDNLVPADNNIRGHLYELRFAEAARRQFMNPGARVAPGGEIGLPDAVPWTSVHQHYSVAGDYTLTRL